MKTLYDRLRDMSMLGLCCEIAKQHGVLEIAARDLNTMRDVLRERTMTVETLVAETERLYDNGGCGPEWANTLGFLRTVPFSKHYRTPPKGHSDPEITYAVARNEFDRALNIERRRYA